MKKLLVLSAMAFASFSVMAQDAVVKEAKKLSQKGDFEAAAKMLAPALTSAETLDKAAAWNLQSENAYNHFIAIQTKDTENQLAKKQVPYDTLAMYRAAVTAWEAAIECDRFDQMPNAKGQIKPKYRTSMQNRFKNHGIALVQAGQAEYGKKNIDEALNAWELYIGMRETPIFADVKDFPKDPFFYDIAYYAALLSYQQKDFVKAEKYAKLTAEDPEKAADANEILIFAKKENCKTKEDTLAYVAEIKALHKANPEEQRYFNLLVDHYAHASNAEMCQWAQEEIDADPTNKTAWFMKGYAQMQDEKWDDAVEDFKKAAEIDDTYTEAYFNAGVCLNSKARALQDQLADKNTGTISKDNFAKVKAIIEVSKTFLERAQELDPAREKCNWAYPLYQIYYQLGNTQKADEMEKLLNNK